MKIRPEFVTNSSSSSFIFGKPGEISGLDTYDIESALRGLVHNINYIEKYMESTLSKNNLQLYDKLKKSRHYYKVYLQGFSISMENNPTSAFYEKSLELCDYIKNSEEYTKELKKMHEQFISTIGMSLADFKHCFTYYFTVVYNEVNLNNELEIVISNIHDLKVSNNTNDIIKLLNSMEWLDSSICKQIDIVDCSKLAFEQLGEFAIYNIPLNSISDIMTQLLIHIANKSGGY